MGFKRKRNVDDSPLSISSFGAVSTPDAQSPTPFPKSLDGVMDIDMTPRHSGWDFASASRVKSSDWGNRTRKRVRDNRPDERAIHGMSCNARHHIKMLILDTENTLNKLFAAQRNQPHASPISSDTMALQDTTISKPQRSTLHSFWKQLPAPPTQPPSFASRSQPQLPSCEDCDTSLQSVNDSMDVDMDVDMGSAVESHPYACSDCGKNVCGTCAVVSSRRHCLQCATRGRNSRRWW
jgi:hypothetical protein